MAKGKKTGGRIAGTPNKATAEIKELARQYGGKGIEELAKLAGLVVGATKAESDQARIIAIKELLDRGYGKPTQAIEAELKADGLMDLLRALDGKTRGIPTAETVDEADPVRH